MTPRQIDLVSTLFELEPAGGYPARAAAAASELVGSPGFRLVLRDGTEHRGGINGAPHASSVPIALDGESLGTLHLHAAAPSDEARQRLTQAAASLLARGLSYSRRLGGSVREASRALAESPLTPRERDVVTRLVAGASTRDISQAMGLTVSTVNTYMKRIFAKLGVHSRVELVAWVNGTRA